MGSIFCEKIDHPLVIPIYKHLVIQKVLKMNMDFSKYFVILPSQYRNSYNRLVETGGLGGGCSPQVFAKVDLLPIENDSEKKKVAKKYKSLQIPQKLLLATLL